MHMARRCCRPWSGSVRRKNSAPHRARSRARGGRRRTPVEPRRGIRGGRLEEAALRALIYVRLPDGAFDERSFRMLKSIRERRKSNDRITRSQFKTMLNVQLQLVQLDEERAIDAVPKLLRDRRRHAATGARCVNLSSAHGALDREGQRRWARIEKLFGAEPKPSRSRKVGNG